LDALAAGFAAAGMSGLPAAALSADAVFFVFAAFAIAIPGLICTEATIGH
jgi:hypothetical protein